jgi:hypothetical protein
LLPFLVIAGTVLPEYMKIYKNRVIIESSYYSILGEKVCLK